MSNDQQSIPVGVIGKNEEYGKAGTILILHIASFGHFNLTASSQLTRR